MRKHLLIAAAAAMTVLAGPAIAKDLTKDAMLGNSMDAVKKSLTDMGYEVRKAEMEDGNIEVYFVKGDKKGEVYVSPKTGKIVKMKIK